MKNLIVALILLAVPVVCSASNTYVVTTDKNYVGLYKEKAICIANICYIFVSKTELDQMLVENPDLVFEKEVLYTIHSTLDYANSWSYRTDSFPSYEKGRTEMTKTVTPDERFIAAIMDTGFGLHKDTVGFLHDLGQTENCINFKNDNSIEYTCYDYNSHGTHVAGIISSEQNGTTYGTGYGYVKVLPFNVAFDNGSGNIGVKKIANAIEYLHNAKINNNVPITAVNMSYGSKSQTKYDYNMYGHLKEAEIIAVVAAGNDGDAIPNYPASFLHENIVSVLSLQELRSTYGTPMRTPSSSYGSFVTIAAPGDDIISSIPVFATDDDSKIKYDFFKSIDNTKRIDPYFSFTDSSLQLITPYGMPQIIQDNITSSTLQALNLKRSSIYLSYEGHTPHNNCTVTLDYTINIAGGSITGKNQGRCSDQVNYLNIPIAEGMDRITFKITINSTSNIDVRKINLRVTELGPADKFNVTASQGGTSMAAPYVTGAITAANAVHPSATPQQLLHLLYGTAFINEALDGYVVGKRQIDVESLIRNAAICNVLGDSCPIPKDYYPNKLDPNLPQIATSNTGIGQRNSGEGAGSSGGCSMYNSGNGSVDIAL